QQRANARRDALILDLRALQAVDAPDLARQVARRRRARLHAQSAVRGRLAGGDDLAALDGLTLEHVQLTPLRDQLLVLLAGVGGDDEAPLAFGLLAETHGARALREDRRILGFACLEEVGDTRESSGDVARL